MLAESINVPVPRDVQHLESLLQQDKMKHIQVHRPHTSDIRWMEDNLVFASYRDEFFDRLVAYLQKDAHNDIFLIDEVWVSGMQLRKCYALLSHKQQQVIASINTRTAQVWMNGVYGYDWGHGLS